MIGLVWTHTSNLIEPRKNASSIVTHGGRALFVVGGISGNGTALKSTEFVSLGHTWNGPSLPQPVTSTCFSKINSTTAILIGTNVNLLLLQAYVVLCSNSDTLQEVALLPNRAELIPSKPISTR